jgi:hypothetical protein
VVVGDFTTTLSPTGHPDKKINKQILELNDIIYVMELTDVYRVSHPAIAQYALFSAVHATFSKIDHVLGHKASLSKYKKIEIIPCILFDHNALKLELNNKNNSRKYTNT